MTVCAAFCRESRMKLINAIELDSNPGVAEGSAVRLSLSTNSSPAYSQPNRLSIQSTIAVEAIIAPTTISVP